MSRRKRERESNWLCASCGGQYDLREANRVLKIQARCRPEDIWVSKAHTPPLGACDNLINALMLVAHLGEKENFIEAVQGEQQEKYVGGFEAVH